MKLGYNELGYYKHSVITNKFFSPNDHYIHKSNKFSRSQAVCYNRYSLYIEVLHFKEMCKTNQIFKCKLPISSIQITTSLLQQQQREKRES